MKTVLNIFSKNYINLLAVATISIAVSSIAVAQEGSPKKTDSEYVNNLLPEARRIQEIYGIPLDLTIAIARHESGNGKVYYWARQSFWFEVR